MRRSRQSWSSSCLEICRRRLWWVLLTLCKVLSLLFRICMDYRNRVLVIEPLECDQRLIPCRRIHCCDDKVFVLLVLQYPNCRDWYALRSDLIHERDKNRIGRTVDSWGICGVLKRILECCGSKELIGIYFHVSLYLCGVVWKFALLVEICCISGYDVSRR